MARLEMKKMRICALKKYRQPLLEELQRAGMLQLVDEPLPEEGPFEKADTQEVRSEFERSAQSCRQALEVLDQYAPEKSSMLSSLEGRTALAPEEWKKRTAGRQELEEVARRLTEESEYALHELLGRVEPTLVLGTALLVGVILLSVMLPLMNIMAALG